MMCVKDQSAAVAYAAVMRVEMSGEGTFYDVKHQPLTQGVKRCRVI